MGQKILKNLYQATPIVDYGATEYAPGFSSFHWYDYKYQILMSAIIHASNAVLPVIAPSIPGL